MKISCSRGHIYDLDTFRGKWDAAGKTAGCRCGMVMSYDRMTGSTYCGRILKEIDKNGCIEIRGKKIQVIKK